MQASNFFDIYRRQFETAQNLAAASLSGFERAQQVALTTYRQALNQQLELAGRMSDRATEAALDPEQVRPVMDELMRVQRDMMQAVSETQRRCVEAISASPSAAGDDSTAWVESMRQSIDRWQRFTEQVLQAARDQTETLGREAHEQARSVTQAVGQAGREAAQQGAHTLQGATGGKRDESGKGQHQQRSGHRSAETA